MNTDTPRTEEQRKWSIRDPYADDVKSAVDMEFAKRLERELNAANAEIERLKNQPREIICTKCGLREERGEKPNADF